MNDQRSANAGNELIGPMRAAIAPRSRPQRPGRVSASLVFAWRALLKIKHVPEQLGDVIGIPLLFTVLFTYLFGGALAGSTHSYLQFLLPGTLVLAVVFVTVYSGVTLNSDLATGAFDRFRSMPTWRPAPIIGGLIGDAGRYLLASLMVMAVGIAMGYRPEGNVLGAVGGVCLVIAFGLSLSWVWMTLGALLRQPNAVLSAGLVVLFPLTFVSNAFVAPKTMPAWLGRLARINPVTHLVTAERGLLHGTATGGQILWVLAAAAVITMVFAPITMRLYARER